MYGPLSQNIVIKADKIYRSSSSLAFPFLIFSQIGLSFEEITFL